METRHRSWTYTFFWKLEEQIKELEKWLSENCTYYCHGREVCPTTKKNHLQGWCVFKNPRGLKGLYGGLHWEIRRGTIDENEIYVKKDDDFVTWGELPKQGKRNDISRVKEMIREGANMAEVIEECNSYQAMRCAELVMKYNKKCTPREVEVIWIYGPSGTGKTRRVLEEFPEAFIFGDMNEWWDGYDGEEVVLIDDYRKKMIGFRTLLRILDVNKVSVPIKGGSRKLEAKKIFVTSPEHPERYVPIGEEAYQLTRRIKKIIFSGTEVKGNTDLDITVKDSKEYEEDECFEF